jgi:hypothetical protein
MVIARSPGLRHPGQPARVMSADHGVAVENLWPPAAITPTMRAAWLSEGKESAQGASEVLKNFESLRQVGEDRRLPHLPHHWTCRSASGGSRSTQKALVLIEEAQETESPQHSSGHGRVHMTRPGVPTRPAAVGSRRSGATAIEAPAAKFAEPSLWSFPLLLHDVGLALAAWLSPSPCSRWPSGRSWRATPRNAACALPRTRRATSSRSGRRSGAPTRPSVG